MNWLSYIIIGLLISLIIVLAYYLYKFAKIIMVFEDHISEILDATNETEKSLDSILELKLFFDSQEIQQILTSVRETIKYSKIRINNAAARFVELSNNKYVSYIDEPNLESENELSQEKLSEEDRIKNALKIPRYTTTRQLPARFQERIE